GITAPPTILIIIYDPARFVSDPRLCIPREKIVGNIMLIQKHPIINAHNDSTPPFVVTTIIAIKAMKAYHASRIRGAMYFISHAPLDRPNVYKTMAPDK